MADIKHIITSILFIINLFLNLFCTSVFLNKNLFSQRPNRYLLFRSLADVVYSFLNLLPRFLFLLEPYYSSTWLIDISHIICSFDFYFIDCIKTFGSLMILLFSTDQLYSVVISSLASSSSTSETTVERIRNSWLRRYPLCISLLSLMVILIVQLHGLYLVQQVFDTELNECTILPAEGDNMIINWFVQIWPEVLGIVGMQLVLWSFIFKRPKSLFYDSDQQSQPQLQPQPVEQQSSITPSVSPYNDEPTVIENSSTRTTTSNIQARINIPIPLFLMLMTLNLLCFVQLLPSFIFLYEIFIFILYSEYTAYEDWQFTLKAIAYTSISFNVCVYFAFHEKFRLAAFELVCKIADFLVFRKKVKQDDLLNRTVNTAKSSSSTISIVLEETANTTVNTRVTNDDL